MTNTYGGNNSSLLYKALYGNGDYVEYAYDNLGQVTEQKLNGTPRYQWQYDSFGNVFKHKDLAGGLTHQYEYDTTGRLQSFWTTGAYQMEGSYQYDKNNNVDRVTYTVGNSAGLVSDYMYDPDNRGTLSMLDSTESRNSYDQVGRVKEHTLREDYDKPVLKSAYTYKNYSGQTGLQTCGRIDNIKYYKDSTLTNTFTMTYDTPYNIVGASDTDTGKGATYSYYANKADGSVDYSDYTQLARENNQYSGLTTLYEYDTAGNILRKKEYAYTTGNPAELKRTVEYEYGDSEWKDLLTAYDGKAITYDEIGNPAMYLYKWHMYWDGRQLTSAVGYGSNYANISYTYNADGIRTKKINDHTQVTDYYLDGSRIIRQESPSGSFDFYYDSSGRMQKMVFYRQSTAVSGGVTYFPRYNGFGDVTALQDAGGNIVARYAYDAWGKVLSVTDGSGTAITDRYHVGNQNPFRYRGYYYDTDTEFYYLQSRYYDPETGRFINGDGYASTGQRLGENMFTYCGNNPVMYTDPSGDFWKEIGNWFKNAWNSVKTWASNTFGAGAKVVQQAKQETELVPSGVNQLVTLKTGTKESKTISSKGNSSKPISVYAQGRSDNAALSSVGLKINIASVTLNISLGLDNIGISGSLTNGNTTNSFGIRTNLSELKVGYEGSTTVEWDANTNVTTYTNASVTGWGIAAAYMFVTTGQWILSPQQSYSKSPAY